MGSRIKLKPERLFEVFVEIAKPDGGDEAPFIIQQHPADFDDKESMAMIPKFAYPCHTDASKVDHFTFVLTDLDSMFRFGYCRHATGHQTCLCIVSWLPWCEIFFKMLDLLAEILNRSADSQVSSFLQSAYDLEVPAPKIPVTIVANEDMFSFTAPDPNVLPSIPNSRNLTEYYNAVDTGNMMVIFASMLHERRIYMTSKKLSRLTACIHAAESLLYPMHWQHLYIPVLPAHLIDYISAPMPYLIGVHSNLVEKLQLNRVDVGDAVIVDLDANTVTSEYDDLGDLPEDVSNHLKRSLKADVVKNSMVKAGDAISKAFLHALVRLIGGYRDALKFRPGEPITFDPEAFVHSRPSQSTQDFLEGMLTLQIFQQFIYGRLEILNAGDGFQDIFEQQATLYADKLNSQSKYKEWLKSVKKSGKKGWNGLKVKMKEQGKKAMADFKTKISGLTDNEDKKTSVSGGIIYTKSGKERPATTHEASLRSTRPPRPPPPSKGSTKGDSLGRAKSMGHSLPPEESHDDTSIRLSYHTVDVSLMGDLDIQAAMLRSASAEMLPSRAEEGESSDTSSETSSDSVEEVDSANIPFDKLHSSDEGLNLASTGNTVSSQPQQQNQTSAGTGDKLIRTRPKTSPAGQPVAPPRGKRIDNTSPKPSPQSSPNVITRNETITSRPPKPVPRQSSLKRATATVPDAPLIKFDSSESEPTDSESFDPLASPHSPMAPSDSAFAATTPQGEAEGDFDEGSKAIQRNTTSRVSLTRSKAFRRDSPGAPLRSGARDDTSDNDSSGQGSTADLFDPLSDLSGLSMTNNIHVSTDTPSGGATHPIRSDPLSSHSPRRDSSDLLMHEWSLASLAKSPTVTMPVGTQHPLRYSFPNNPFLSSPRQQNAGTVRQSLPTSVFTSAPPGRSVSSNIQRFSGQAQPLNQGSYLGQCMPAVHHVNSPGQQQQQPVNMSFPSSATTSHSTPGRLTPTSFGPFAQQQSSSMPQNTRVMNFTSPSPTPSTSSLYVHGGFKHVQAPSSSVGGKINISSSNPSSSTNNSLKQSDPFSDLLGISFGGSTTTQPAAQQQQQQVGQVSAPPSRPPQPKWETFD